MPKYQPTVQTVLNSAHYDENGIITYRLANGKPVKLLYCVAQQAMLGKVFKERYPVEAFPLPHAEHFDITMLPSPVGDPVARAAANWLIDNAFEHKDGSLTWMHDFDFVYKNGDKALPAPWSAGIGQAQVLLACLHWWRHSGDEKWRSMAECSIKPFLEPLSIEKGIFFEDESGGHWFEEIPAPAGRKPTHILNGHMLALIALHHAYTILNSQDALNAFDKGWNLLKSWIGRYDKGNWSRYDQPDSAYLFLRLVPSAAGKAYLEKMELSLPDGQSLSTLKATEEVHDFPVSRLCGMDWGPLEMVDGHVRRLITNNQEAYRDAIPAGGTNQNTYVYFDEDVDFGLYGDSGLVLTIDACMEDGAEVTIEYKDPRETGLVFNTDESLTKLSGDGCNQYVIPIPARLIGKPLPPHYHRLHVELLHTLLEFRKDSGLESIFKRWHRGALYDQNTLFAELDELPRTVYVFVNDKCGLHCKMCDFGQGNKEAALTQLMTRTEELDPDLFINRVLRAKNPTDHTLTMHLCGTEPLLYQHYTRLVKEAKKNNWHTIITTNGLKLQKEAANIVKCGLDELYLSIDGPPDVHDEVRAHKGLFQKICDGIKEVERYAKVPWRKLPEVTINFTISRDNHKRILEFIESVRVLKPKMIMLSHLNYVTPQMSASHNSAFPNYHIAPSSMQAREDALEMDFFELFWQIEEAKKTEWTEVCVIPNMPTPNRLKWFYTEPMLPISRTICGAPWACMQILCNGKVTVGGRCFNVELGDLVKESIADIWQGEKYSEIRGLLKAHPWMDSCLRCCGSL